MIATKTPPKKLRTLAEAIYHVSEMGESKYDSIQNIEEILNVIYEKKELKHISVDLKTPGVVHQEKLIEFFEANPNRRFKPSM